MMTESDATETGAVQRRYYYIFDSRTERALVLNPETGEEYVWDDDPRVPLLRHVQTETDAATIRAFALDCARTTGVDAADDDSATGRLWAAASEIDDADDASSIRASIRPVREPASDDVVLALTAGLPEKEPDAARLLAAHACTHPDVEHAAIDAMHMSERYAEFEAAHAAESAEASDDDAPPAPAAAAQAMRQRHVNRLLDLIAE